MLNELVLRALVAERAASFERAATIHRLLATSRRDRNAPRLRRQVGGLPSRTPGRAEGGLLLDR